VNPFFDELGKRFTRAAARRGVEVMPPGLDPAVARELLDLARVAAHTEERRFAPLVTFMAGVATERIRQAGGAASPEAVAALIREIREELESAPSTRDAQD
jgi:site-specific DNA-cytosine methylase